MNTTLFISEERRYDLLTSLLLEYGKNPDVGQDKKEFLDLMSEVSSEFFKDGGMTSSEAFDFVEDQISYLGIGFGREDYIDDFLQDLDYLRAA